MNRSWLALGAAALLAGPAQPVSARECEGCASSASVSFWSSDWNPSFYAGAGFQQSMFEDWDAVTQVDSASYTSRNEDESDSGYRVFAGMDFLEHFGVEASYTDFGEARLTAQSDGSGLVFAPGEQRDSVELDGFSLHMIARVPVGKDFSFSGKAGASVLQARQRVSGTVYSPPGSGFATPFSLDQSDTSTRLSWGAAFDYNGFMPVRVSLAYEAATFEAPNTDAISGASDIRSLGLSLGYYF